MKTSTKFLFGAAVSAGVVIAAVKLNRFLSMDPMSEPLSKRMVDHANEATPNGKTIKAVAREAKREGGIIRTVFDLRDIQVELTIPPGVL